jgi:ferredoxin-thioredoxin reductase catalytic subunit
MSTSDISNQHQQHDEKRREQLSSVKKSHATSRDTLAQQCACRGRAPQMREHTATHCSVITTREARELMTAFNRARS